MNRTPHIRRHVDEHIVRTLLDAADVEHVECVFPPSIAMYVLFALNSKILFFRFEMVATRARRLTIRTGYDAELFDERSPLTRAHQLRALTWSAADVPVRWELYKHRTL